MPIPICVIGTGQIGERHVSTILAEPLVHLSCIVEPNPAPGPAPAGVPHFNSVREMLSAREKGEVEVAGAVLATPK